MTTILKEMRIAQLCSKSERTLDASEFQIDLKWPRGWVTQPHLSRPFRGPLVLKQITLIELILEAQYILQLKKYCLITFFNVNLILTDSLTRTHFSLFHSSLCPYFLLQSANDIQCLYYYVFSIAYIDEIVFLIQEYLPLVWLRLGLARVWICHVINFFYALQL